MLVTYSTWLQLSIQLISCFKNRLPSRKTLQLELLLQKYSPLQLFPSKSVINLREHKLETFFLELASMCSYLSLPINSCTVFDFVTSIAHHNVDRKLWQKFLIWTVYAKSGGVDYINLEREREGEKNSLLRTLIHSPLLCWRTENKNQSPWRIAEKRYESCLFEVSFGP